MSGFKAEDNTSWAPRHTQDLFGHEAAEAELLAAWSSGRLPHAWLITGPRGVGKATLAFRFARFLLRNGTGGAAAAAAPADDGPGLFGLDLPAAPAKPATPTSLHVPETDPLFQRVAGYGHGDVITVERSWDDDHDRWRSGIVVSDVRAVHERFAKTAAEGGYRVCIVDAADEMNTSAANALLKILEEPPPGAILLLVTHAPGELLPTIRSRCRRLALKPLNAAAMRQAMERLLPQESTAERQALAVAAEGSPGRAIHLAHQDGLALLRAMLELIGGLPKLDVENLHKLGDRFGPPGQAQAFFSMMELFRWWLARLIRAAAAGGAGGAGWEEIFAGEAALAARVAAWMSPNRWVEEWEEIGRLLDRGESVNLERKQMLLNIFATLSRVAAAGTRGA